MLSPTAPYTPGRILIVDDNDFGLVARQSLLAELGHEIVTSKNPEEALAFLTSRKFDLIVTDFRMPQMNGVEFIRQIRAIDPLIPVILLSGFTEALGLSEETTGANAVIQKNAGEVNHLIRTVNRLMKKTAKKPASSTKSARRPAKAKKAGAS